MPSDLKTSMFISASGMRAQGARLRTISENLANANSGPENVGDEPYRRRVVTFNNVFVNPTRDGLTKFKKWQQE